jgi:hypothetical protein
LSATILTFLRSCASAARSCEPGEGTGLRIRDKEKLFSRANIVPVISNLLPKALEQK